MNTIKIENPELGEDLEAGPFNDEELWEIAETIEKIKGLDSKEFCETTTINHTSDCLCLYDYKIAKGRAMGHFQLKSFDENADQDEIDKWGEFYGYLLWKGIICPYKIYNDLLDNSEEESNSDESEDKPKKNKKKKVKSGKMKAEARFLAITDAPFRKVGLSRKDFPETTKIIGVITKGGTTLEGVLSSEIGIDKLDSTDKMVEMVNTSRFKQQIRAIFLKGLSVGGFNLVDINELYQRTGIPVIIINRKKADPSKMITTLEKLKFDPKFAEIVRNTPSSSVYGATNFQVAGAEDKEVNDMIILTRTNSEFLPEPLRIACLIASGITFRESKGSK